MSVLKCENLKKSYGRHTVLEDLNLTLESGRIYGLIGRNGAGKTTLLSMMANQNPVSGGCVTLDGENIWENRRALDRICFSRELSLNTDSGLAAFPVKSYLEAAATYYPCWDSAMAQALVTRFGLNTKQKLGKLSKGMLSMVTIVVALASRAEFTFLDEPVAGLDVVAREEFYRLLLAEYAETGRTFVISTHIIEEAADVMEEVIILDRGRTMIKENTQGLLERARYVSGLAQAVDRVTGQCRCHGVEKMGRSKGVTVLLEPGQQLPEDPDVTQQPVSLQKLFVALCAGEEPV